MSLSTIISTIVWIVTGIISWNLIDPQNFPAGVLFIVAWFIIGNIGQFIAGSIFGIIMDQISSNSILKPSSQTNSQNKISNERISFEKKTTYPLADYIIKALRAYEDAELEYSNIISLLSTDLKAKIQSRQNIKLSNQISNLLFLLLSCCFLSILFQAFRENKLEKKVNNHFKYKIADEVLNSFLKRSSSRLNLSNDKYASLYKMYCDNIVDLNVQYKHDQNLIRLTDEILNHLNNYVTDKEVTVDLLIDYFDSFKLATDTRLKTNAIL